MKDKAIQVIHVLLLAVTSYGTPQDPLKSDKTLTDLQTVTFQKVNSTLECTNCNIFVLKTDMFNFSTNGIISIDLNDTQIIIIEKQAFKTFKNLEELVLSYNYLKFLESDLFSNITNLTKIDLSHNNIRDITDDTFLGLNNLRKLNLGYNDIVSINNSFPRFIEILNLEHNKLKSLNGKEFGDLPYLKDLNLANNQIQSLILNFTTINNVEVISLQYNNIEYINKKTFQEVRYVRNVDLCHNKIRKLAPQSFINFQRLENLNISFNKLHKLSSDQIKSSFKLKLVNASFNDIEILNFTDLLYSVTVENFDVSNNEICTFSTSIFSRFSHLNIQNNFLTCQEETEIKKFYYLKDNDFFGSRRCTEDNSNKTDIENELKYKCKLKLNRSSYNGEVIKIIIIVVISAPVIIILLYCGFVKKQTFCQKTINNDYYNWQTNNATADLLLETIDDVVHAIGHGASNIEEDDDGN